MMKFILAPDSFKGSLSASEACWAMQKGIRKVFPNAEIISLPMADGGEGTIETILTALQGEKVELMVHDPYMRPIPGYYGIVQTHTHAVGIVEMAVASGLPLLKKEEYNPLKTTTYGTGELMKDALDKGCKEIVVCVGGSATNDAGMGMLRALGIRFLDKNHQEIGEGGEALANLQKIDGQTMDQRLKNVTLTVACDVDNPLYGEKGAAYTFAPQKGATQEVVEILDKNLRHLADIVQQTATLPDGMENNPGAGAAGGLGYGLMTFTNAKSCKGASFVMDILELEKHLQNSLPESTLLLTGEGEIDFQTKFGKVPFAVAQLAQKYRIPVIALAGKIGKGAEALYNQGIHSMFSITNKPMSLENAMRDATDLLEHTTENIVRLRQTFCK